MKVSEFRSFADALSKFATTREKSKGPESKIGVQVSSGRLKLIAGSDVAGIVIDVMPIEGKYTYAIEARPFLQSAKVLPARQEVNINVTPERFEILAEGGGKMALEPSCSLADAGFPKKPKAFEAKASVYGEKFTQLAKLFKGISAKVEVPCIRTANGRAYAIAVAPGNRPMYASLELPAEGKEEYSASAYLEFWSALRALDKDGSIEFGRQGVLAKSENIECYSAPYLVSRYNQSTGMPELAHEPEPWPILGDTGNHEVLVTLNKRDLLTIVKGQAPFDEHNRVTLSVDVGMLNVSAFGSDTGQTIPVEGRGHGARSVKADYMATMLSNMDAKQVSLGWGGGSPPVSITAQEYSSWTILLAPVAM
jgi:hypothetical protein